MPKVESQIPLLETPDFVLEVSKLTVARKGEVPFCLLKREYGIAKED
jgi:hypothetical protein